MREVQPVPEEISLSALRNQIERESAIASATNDALMCLMEVISEADPALKRKILDKLDEAIETAEELGTPEVATELEAIRGSLQHA